MEYYDKYGNRVEPPPAPPPKQEVDQGFVNWFVGVGLTAMVFTFLGDLDK